MPTRMTRVSPLYDVFQVSSRRTDPSAAYTVRVTDVLLGVVPDSSTTVFPFGSFGVSTRSTGTGPVTSIVPGELSTRRDSPP